MPKGIVDKQQIDKRKMVQTNDLHCVSCGRFLLSYAIVWGTVKVKCGGCKEWNTIDVTPDERG